MTRPSTPSEPVAAWWDAVPPRHRATLGRLDALIHNVAMVEGVAPVVVELKWGQPSYRSSLGNVSTPIRLAWTDDGDVAILTHCQSSVIPEFREAHGDRFRIDGTRAVLIDPDAGVHDSDEDALAELIVRALTYRRREAAPARPGRARR